MTSIPWFCRKLVITLAAWGHALSCWNRVTSGCASLDHSKLLIYWCVDDDVLLWQLQYVLQVLQMLQHNGTGLNNGHHISSSRPGMIFKLPITSCRFVRIENVACEHPKCLETADWLISARIIPITRERCSAYTHGIFMILVSFWSWVFRESPDLILLDLGQ